MQWVQIQSLARPENKDPSCHTAWLKKIFLIKKNTVRYIVTERQKEIQKAVDYPKKSEI